MGKAARWLRNFLGGGRKESNGSKEQRPATGNGSGVVDKKRWSFGKSSRDSAESAAAAAAVGGNAAIAKAAEAAWLKSLYAETEREQSKHAIAVAAATAAAADAAVAAAQAAVAVVRLTSHGRGSSVFAGSGGNGGDIRDRRATAAVRIQTAFRGFLAKKALRALKALVKLQALVRGYLVRKQAAATLHSMQALIRAQATIRAHKSRGALHHDRHFHHHHPPVWPRRSLQESYVDDTGSEHGGVPAYSRRLSASIEAYGYDRSPKIVEMDTGRPKSRSSSRRTSPPVLDTSGDDYYANSVSSPLPCHLAAPARIAIPSSRNFQDYDWGALDKCRPATAQSTPRYMNMPVTPAKSVSGAAERLMYASNCPNYMSNTQSFEAKVRSQSTPKQRPEPGIGIGNGNGNGIGMRKRVPLSEVMVESRASLSGIGMQRSCNRVQEAFNFKTAIVGRLDRSSEAAERGREVFLQRRW